MSNSVPVLTLSPAWNATEVYADTTSYTQLGDGYSINSAASVHPNAVEWNISRVGLSKIEIDEIVSFLSALGGVAGFLWSPHESIGRRLFFCEKWNVDFLGENVYGFTATFTEDVRGECLAFAALIDTNEIISQLNQSSVFINNFTLSSGSYLVNSNNNLVVRSLHTHSEQIPSDSGTLYDQVILALACLNAYTTTNASVWLTRATNYANAIVTNYYNSDVNGTLYLPHWLYDVKTDNRKEDIYFTLRTLNTGEVNTPLGWLPMLWELYDRLYQITNDSQWQTLANRTKNDAITAATFSNQSYVYRKNLGSVTEYPGTQIIGTATRILDGELEGFVEVSGSSDLTVQNLANQTDLTSDTSYTVEASADTNDRIVEFFVSTSTDDSNESQIYRHFVLLDDVAVEVDIVAPTNRAGAAVVGTELYWTPANITTTLWLKEEGTDSSWTDHSGNDYHATQATESARPSIANTLNGLTVRTFDGSNDYLETPSLPLNTPTSLFVVFRTETLSGDRALINQQYGDAPRPWQHYFSATGRLFEWRSGAYIPSITAGNYFILSEVQSSTAVGGIMMWRDGNAGIASFAANSYAESKAMSIGRAQTFGSIGWMQGRIAEVVLVGSAVDTATRQKVEGYLAHKWGLTANLPADHPYKVSPPTI